MESALKDRWLYVTAGPLAGKQFILYKSETSIGSRQESDIYLFKDANILPRHAVIQINGARVQLRRAARCTGRVNPFKAGCFKTVICCNLAVMHFAIRRSIGHDD